MELNRSDLRTGEFQPISKAKEVDQMTGYTEKLRELEKLEVQEMESGWAPDSGSRSYERTRPRGVSVIAGLNMFGGVVIALLLLAVAGEIGEPGVGLMGLGLGGTQFAIGLGLWRLKRWARIVALVLYSINCLGALAQLGQNPIAGLLGLAIAGTILAYLSSRAVKEVFTGIKDKVEMVSD